jgi:tripartite-type tricarboxylate transporter receptor subunit TctC
MINSRPSRGERDGLASPRPAAEGTIPVAKRRATLAALACAALAPSWLRAATRDVRLVVPFPRGGLSDRVARTLAPPLGEALAASVAVDNVPEDSGVRSFIDAKPDGSALLLGSTGSVVITPLTASARAFDPLTQLAPICLLGSAPSILTVHPSLPVTRMDELIAHLRARPGEVTMGSPGVGSLPHFAGLLFVRRTGVAVETRTYAGSGALIEAHARGEVKIAFENQVVERVRAGQLRAIAVMTNVHVSTLKGVPTASEAGVPGIDIGSWTALFGPPRMPEPMRVELARHATRALAHASFAALADAGMEVRPGTPDQLARFLAAEVERWTRYVREVGLAPAPAKPAPGR